MLAAQYEIICEQVSDLSHTAEASRLAPAPGGFRLRAFLVERRIWLGGELHQAIVARQAKVHGARPCLQLEGQRFCPAITRLRPSLAEGFIKI